MEADQGHVAARLQELQASQSAAELINASCQDMLSLVKDQQLELVQVRQSGGGCFWGGGERGR